MKVTIAHADTCLPDYWGSHHLPHVMIPAYPQSFASVRRAIADEIRMGAVMGADDDARLLSADMVRPCEESRADMLTRKVYAAINRDIKPARKGDRLAFRDVEVSDDCGESVYAYFVIIVESEPRGGIRCERT